MCWNLLLTPSLSMAVMLAKPELLLLLLRQAVFIFSFAQKNLNDLWGNMLLSVFFLAPEAELFFIPLILLFIVRTLFGKSNLLAQYPVFSQEQLFWGGGFLLWRYRCQSWQLGCWQPWGSVFVKGLREILNWWMLHLSETLIQIL